MAKSCSWVWLFCLFLHLVATIAGAFYQLKVEYKWMRVCIYMYICVLCTVFGLGSVILSLSSFLCNEMHLFGVLCPIVMCHCYIPLRENRWFCDGSWLKYPLLLILRFPLVELVFSHPFCFFFFQAELLLLLLFLTSIRLVSHWFECV